MNNNRSLVFLVLLIIPVFFLAGCEGCNDRSYTYGFSQADLAIVPYHGDEVLQFKSGEGDSVIYSCSGRVNVNDNPIYLRNEDCNNLVLHVPSNTTTFLSGSDTLTVQLYISAITPSLARKILNITFTSLEPFSIEGYTWNYGFDADTILVYPNYPSQADGAVAFHDSLTIIHKKFLKVYELISRRTPAVPEEFIRSVFYTLENGIVGFRTNKSVSWEIK